MKIIDLLNKIANGEEDLPRIIVAGENEDKHYYDKNLKEYINERTHEKLFEDGYGKFLKYFINDEVEIIEEDKKIPEKLKSLNNIGNSKDLVEFKDKQQLNNHLLKDKLNEVIHYLQYLKSKGE